MLLKRLAMNSALVAVLLAPALSPAQTTMHPAASAGANHQPPPSSIPSVTLPQTTAGAAARPDCAGTPCDYQPTHITVANPPQLPVPWPLRDQIAWSANLVLVLLGYVAIMVALSTLRKIERQTRYAEAAAETASTLANAALLHAQALVNSERPWLLVSVEPTIKVENSFNIVVTNRGRSPARILAGAEQIRVAVDEAQLPSPPAFDKPKPSAPPVPVILLPNESTVIKIVTREDARELCDSDEQFKRVEDWEVKIFIYGKVIYQDLIAPEDKKTHETFWCCWYIHGRQKSGLVIAGPPEYNQHT
jgi:hypothetical protein